MKLTSTSEEVCHDAAREGILGQGHVGGEQRQQSCVGGEVGTSHPCMLGAPLGSPAGQACTALSASERKSEFGNPG